MRSNEIFEPVSTRKESCVGLISGKIVGILMELRQNTAVAPADLLRLKHVLNEKNFAYRKMCLHS